MKDPWRAQEPPKQDKVKRADEGERVNVEDKDRDADLRPMGTEILRFSRCSISVRSRDVQAPEDALVSLSRCLTELSSAGFKQALEVIPVGTGPSDARPAGASCLSNGRVAVWFKGRTLDEGTLALSRLLAIAARHSSGGPVMRKYGITAMLKA